MIPTETRPITPDEYVKMIEAGILKEDERLELLYGRVVPIAPQNDPHALALGELVHQLNRLIGADQLVWVQTPQPDGVYTDLRSYRETDTLPVLDGTLDIDRVLRHA